MYHVRQILDLVLINCGKVWIKLLHVLEAGMSCSFIHLKQWSDCNASENKIFWSLSEHPLSWYFILHDVPNSQREIVIQLFISSFSGQGGIWVPIVEQCIEKALSKTGRKLMGNFSNCSSSLFELILPDNEGDLCIRICLSSLFFHLAPPSLFQKHGGTITTLN